MGSKGGGSSTNTSYTSSLPEYAEPYYHDLMANAEAVAQMPYTPYGGERISGFTGDQITAQQGTRDLYGYGAPAMDAAQQYGTYGTAAALGSYYDPTLFDPNNPNFQMQHPGDVSTGVFDSNVRDWYMSPYMDAVVTQAQKDARLQDERQASSRQDEAIRAGAFGGNRQAVGDYLAEEGLLNRLNQIYTTGQESAYQNAQQQYERDRGAGLQAALANQNVGLQTGMANMGSYLDAARLAEQSRQFGADYGMRGIETGLQGAGMLGDLSQADQALTLERLAAMSGVGGEQQALTQSGLSQAYEDFVNQRDYDRQSLSWLAGIMGGVPVSAESTVVQTQPAPNPISQLAGLGIAGLGLYNTLS